MHEGEEKVYVVSASSVEQGGSGRKGGRRGRGVTTSAVPSEDRNRTDKVERPGWKIRGGEKEEYI